MHSYTTRHSVFIKQSHDDAYERFHDIWVGRFTKKLRQNYMDVLGAVSTSKKFQRLECGTSGPVVTALDSPVWTSL